MERRVEGRTEVMEDEEEDVNNYWMTIYNGPTNALDCNKTLIQLSQTETFKITPTCFDHQMIETCWSDFKCFSV
jgi:hypothetical protein